VGARLLPRCIEPGELRLAADEEGAGGGQAADVEVGEGRGSGSWRRGLQEAVKLPGQRRQGVLHLVLFPRGEGLSVLGPALDRREPLHLVPRTGLDDQRDDQQPIRRPPLQQVGYLCAENESRGQEIRRDQEDGSRRAIHRLLDGRLPIGPGGDLAIVPDLEAPLGIEDTEMADEAVLPPLILVAVADEDCARARRHWKADCILRRATKPYGRRRTLSRRAQALRALRKRSARVASLTRIAQAFVHVSQAVRTGRKPYARVSSLTRVAQAFVHMDHALRPYLKPLVLVRKALPRPVRLRTFSLGPCVTPSPAGSRLSPVDSPQRLDRGSLPPGREVVGAGGRLGGPPPAQGGGTRGRNVVLKPERAKDLDLHGSSAEPPRSAPEIPILQRGSTWFQRRTT
jgi:hypothetical protein